MPANLTPQYQKAEREFRRAQTPADQIDCLQRMLQLIPKHKGTERLQASLKTRLKEANQQLSAAINTRSTSQFRLPRQGAGRIVIVGPPNSGKSQLLRSMTRATPEVSPWPFTTREPSPGMLSCFGIQVQLVDTPPVCPGQLAPWLLNLVRTADGVLLLLDGSNDDAPEQTLAVVSEFEQRKTRLSTVSGFDEDSFAVLQIPAAVVMTRCDAPDATLRREIFSETADRNLPVLEFEANRPETLPPLTHTIFGLLDIIRVYTRRPGDAPDLADPVTIPIGGTVEDLALHLHEELFRRVTSARIRRRADDGSISSESLVVGRQHKLCDGDIVELH
ncbi:MAG: 50S ribosome-binding GTPase [Planctomycetaceae bacterium]|nr:50S ribosome-binding GTPase [Planctomycetaceae bacterium]